MKIAIFHNYLDNIGGAEIVALTLAKELDADIYTTNINPEKIIQMGFASILNRIHSLGRIPKQAPFRQQLAFWKFRRLNLTGQYDFFIIAGDWAMSAAVHNRPNLWYIHSPLNELWEFRDFIRNNILSHWKASPYDLWVWFNRKLTLKYAQSVDLWVCNSQNTKNRTKKFYDQEATIINPPVMTNRYNWQKSKNYWLSVNRLITHKRIEIQMEAFRLLPEEKLIIVGSYEKGVKQFESYKSYLEKIRPVNVNIIHWANDQELKNLYGTSRGFITTAKDEDFGLTVVEAMAAGKPVIAPAEGGYKETITSQTGRLLKNIDSGQLAQAVREMSEELKKEPEKYRVSCKQRAAEFDTAVFIKKIKEEIEKYNSNVARR